LGQIELSKINSGQKNKYDSKCVRKMVSRWSAITLSPNEVDEIYRLIQKAKCRSANIKPILQTIALALAGRKQLLKKNGSFSKR
jgi:hypothetical protein